MHRRGVDQDGPGVPRASRLVVVLAWALAVLVAGAVTSWAVGVISNEQGPARDRVLAASQVTAELAAQRALTSATPAAPPSPTATPDVEPSAIPTETPSTAPAPTDSAAPPPPPPVAAEVARTWDVAGGQVGASCTGPDLRLLYATPIDGWTVEVKHAGSDELEVAFRQHDAETTIHASCVGGVPTQDTDRD